MSVWRLAPREVRACRKEESQHALLDELELLRNDTPLKRVFAIRFA